MTKTEAKRMAFPERYARKDARREIYRALYGVQDGPLNKPRVNDPSIDESRQLPKEWKHSQAKQAFDELVELAEFKPSRRWMLEARLDNLAKYRRGGSQ